MEIGFNSGSATDTILSTRDDIKAVSFDIMHWDYVYCAKKYIDKMYLGRHPLVSADSTKTIPKHTPDTKSDLIFIDGGHSLPTPSLDLKNSKRLSHAGTLIVMDDYCLVHGIHVMKAWDDAVKKRVINQIGDRRYLEIINEGGL